MKTEEQKHLDWWYSLTPLHITINEAKKLPEYSATNPTGVIVGKRWRRHNGAFDHDAKRLGVIPRWVICEYQEAPPDKIRAPDPEGKQPWVWKTVEMCKIVFYRPIITQKMMRAVL